MVTKILPRSSSLLALLLLNYWTASCHGHSQQLTVDCIDNVADFEQNNWSYFSDSAFDYAESGEDLPEKLKGKIDAQGIFYTEGYVLPKSIWRDPKYLNAQVPTYVYVRYYNHLTREDNLSLSFVSPAVDGNSLQIQRLNATSNFEWAEQFIRIETESMMDMGIRICSFFNYGDYFFVDKFILAQGEGISGIEDVKKLCQTEPPTTQAPPVGFQCPEKPGNYADPQDCAVFHVCQIHNGQPWDTPMTCPTGTVWCQQEDNCQYEHLCPCSVS